jgi:hypothetical protein
VDDHEYLQHAQEQLAGDLDDIPTQSEAWGVKLVFMDDYSDRRVASLTPYLFPSFKLAAAFATWISVDESCGEKIAEWVADGSMAMEEGVWTPLFSRAVKLAVVPF